MAAGTGDLTSGHLDAPGHDRPAVSPDGTRIAWISDDGGRPLAYVAPLPADGSPVGERAVPLDVRPSRGEAATLPPDVAALAWSPDGRRLACEIAPAGGERSRVVLADPDGPARSDVAPTAAAVTLGAWSPTGRSLGVTILGDPSGAGRACLVDVRDGSSTVLATGVAPVVCGIGRDGRRAVVRTGPRGDRRLELIDLPSGRRTVLVTGATVAAARFGVTGGTLYLHTDALHEHPALLAVSLGTRGDVSASRVVARRDGRDLDLVAPDPAGRRAALAWNDGGRSALEIADLRGGRPVPLPSPVDVVTGVSFVRDGSALLVAGHGHDAPPAVYRVALPSGRVTPLLPAAPAALGTVRPVPSSFRGEDGLELSGWLLRPTGAAGPGPALVWLHGGPESEERAGFAPLLQRLAATGITVFAPNVRGSSGRGRAFVRSDDRERRPFSLTDVRAAAGHLVRSGLADPERLAVGGRSYGGFLVLAALTRFPGLFRAGVDVCGMSDLETFYAGTEPWVAASAVTEYGDPRTDAALLRSLSPLRSADRITAPLLVVHGERDTNVPLGEAHRIVAALRARSAPVRLMSFADEGHEIHDRHTRARFVRDTVRWVRHALDVRPC